jgi:hypothetical protein
MVIIFNHDVCTTILHTIFIRVTYKYYIVSVVSKKYNTMSVYLLTEGFSSG